MKKDYDGPLYAEWWKVQKFKETSMTKKSKTIGSDTWEWEETPEAKAAIEKLHATKRLHEDIRKLELKAPDYGVGK